MGTRMGRGKILTAWEAERVLAIPLFYVLHGLATPIYPTSDVASPSHWVWIMRTGDIPEWHQSRFPIGVGWKQWHEAVVPVLQDSRFQARVPLDSRAIQDGAADERIDLIARALYLSFAEAGYGPT